MSAQLRTRRNQAGALLALFLLVLRLAVPPYAMPASADPVGRHAAGLVGLLGGVPICHADAGPAPVNTPAAPAHDCALCPVCQIASAPALMPAATWVVAAPLAGLAKVTLPPPSTGPLQPERFAARPRGPPASVV
jgi:hypothetical protein